MDYSKPIVLDVNAMENWQTVFAKQGDILLRKLLIKLTKDNEPYNPTAEHFWFRVEKPDGTIVVQTDTDSESPITKSVDTYIVPLHEQVLAADGIAICDFALLDSDGSILSSSTFKLNIVPMPDMTGGTSSHSDFERLLKAIQEAEGIIHNLQFRVHEGALEYSTNEGVTWKNICSLEELMPVITNEQIDALF